jgi:hypothetical protein
MKLVPAVMLASQFPRPYIPDFLFRNPVDMVQTILAGFFFPAALGNGIQFEPGVGLGRHELEFGLSLVPAVLALLAVRRIRLRRLFDRPILWLVLTSLLLIPLALTFGPESWGDVLLRVPGLNNNSTFVRWWAVYLLPLLVITARCFDLTTSAATRSALLVSCILLAIGQETFNSPSYYAAQALYDPGPVTRAFRRVASGRPIPPIERVVFGPESPQQNDAFVEGASAWPCYEALFGYDLELLRDTGLVTGPITLVSPDGRLNLIDPAGYFARPNSPPATWRFEMSRLSEALKFANYRPYQWPEPGWHVAAVRVTATTVLVSAGYFALRVIGALRSLVSRWRRRTDGPTVSSSR